MSAWYIFTTLGFYPVNPANGEFVLGNSQVKKATIYLSDKKYLEITNNKINSETATYNNIDLDKILHYKQLMQGGKLIFK